MDTLITIDVWLFLRLNASAANSFFDLIMPVITNIKYYRIPILIGMGLLAIFGGGKGRVAVLLALITLTLTDQLSSHVIKPWVGRVRPCHVIEGARFITGCGNTLAFPSGHATNTMAAAIFFGFFYRRWLWPALGLSLLVSYSRVYLGLHYPSDLLGGWILGGGIAGGIVWVYQTKLRIFFDRFRLFRNRDVMRHGFSPPPQEPI